MKYLRHHSTPFGSIIAALVAALLTVHSSPAATLTWDNGATTGLWNTTDANWTASSWNNGTPDDAVFDATGVGAVTLSEAITAGIITLNTAGYTIDTATFGLALNTGITANESATIQSDIGGSIILGAHNTLSVAATKTLSVSSDISGTGFKLSKSGSGTLILSGVNTYDGGTNVDGGVLALGGSAALGTTGTISFGGGTLQFSASNARDYSARFSTAASQAYNLDTNGRDVTLATALTSAGGSLTKSGAGTLTVTAANTYSGLTTINGGTLIVDKNAGSGSLSSSTGLTFGDTSTFEYKGAAAGSAMSVGALTFGGGEGTVQSTYGISGNTSLTFSSLAARTPGAVGNFIVSGGANGTTNLIALTGQATGFIDKGIYFNSGDFASYDAGGYVRAFDYTSDTNAVNITTSGSSGLGVNDATKHVRLANNRTGQTTASIADLKLDGAQSLTITTGNTLTINGILKSGGGTGYIRGSSGNNANHFIDNGGNELTIRTESAADTFSFAQIGSTNSRYITLQGAGGTTISGLGNVNFRLMANTTTGQTNIVNAGTVLINDWTSSFGTATNVNLNGGIIATYANGAITTALGTSAGKLQITGGNSGFNTGNGAIKFNNNDNTEVVWGSSIFNPSTLVIQGGSMTWSNKIDLNGANRTLEVSATQLTISNIIRNTNGTPAGLTKTGDGRLILTNTSNSYDGQTVVNGGVLQLGTSFSNTNAIAGGITANPSTGSNLELNGGIVSYFFDFNRSLGTGAGEIQLTGGVSGFTQKQGDRVNLTFGNAATEVVWGSSVFNPTTLVLNQASESPAAPIKFNNDLDLNGADRTVWTDSTGAASNNAASNSAFGAAINKGGLFAGDIRNTSGTAAGLIKSGAGIIGLSGTNTYDGGSTINEGGLFFSSLVSMPATGAVTVNDGASLIVSVGGGGDWTTGTSGNGTVGGLLAGLGGQSGSTVVYNGNATLNLYIEGTEEYAGNISTPWGIAKSGAGTLTLSGNNSHTGQTAAVGGTLRLASTNAIGTSTLSLNGGNVVLDTTVNVSAVSFDGSSNSSITGGVLSMSGGTITNTDKSTSIVGTITTGITGSPNVSVATRTAGNNYIGGLQFAPSGNATQTLGTISLDKTNAVGDKGGIEIGGVSIGNSVASVTNTSAAFGAFRKRGPGEWTVGSVNFGTFQNYSGTTIAQGLIDGTYTGVTVFGGTLVLDYTFANADKLGNNDPLNLLGGTLQLDRSIGATGTYTEVVPSTVLNGGWASVTRGTGSTATLRMNAITRSVGATLNFGEAGIADTDTLNTNGILGSWATVAGADFAMNSTNAANGLITGYNAYTDVDRLTPGTIADGSTTNVRLIEGTGSAGDITLGTATTIINTLNQSASGGTSAVTLDLAGQTLRSNGILAGAGAGGLTIGSSVDDGTLTAATASGELILHNFSSNPLTINSVIANNGGASRLTLTGTGTTILTGSNSYTGITKISGGVLEAAIGTGLPTTTHLNLDGGVLQSSGLFIQANGNNTTAGQFNWTSEDGGGFSAKGGKLTVTIGNNASTEQTWAWVSDNANTSLALNNNAILGPLKFGSTTADSEVEFQNKINLNGETREINVTVGTGGDFATLSGVIRNTNSNAPAGIYKSGTGILVLTAANTYDGVTTVNAGTLEIASSGSTHASSSVSVNNSGSSLVVNGTLGGDLTTAAGTFLSGTGTINGPAIISGTHNPGNSPGIQTFLGDLSYTGGASVVNWELSTNTNINAANPNAVFDQIIVGGNLDFTDPTVLNLSFTPAGSSVLWNDAFWNSNQSWTLYDVAGSPLNYSNLSLVTTNWLDSAVIPNDFNTARPGSSFSLDLTGQDVILNYTVGGIPEPSRAILMLVGAAGLLMRRRRKGE